MEARNKPVRFILWIVFLRISNKRSEYRVISFTNSGATSTNLKKKADEVIKKCHFLKLSDEYILPEGKFTVNVWKKKTSKKYFFCIFQTDEHRYDTSLTQFTTGLRGEQSADVDKCKQKN